MRVAAQIVPMLPDIEKDIMSADLGQLLELPTIEKLRIIEEPWDDIGSSDASVVVQDWHKAEARKRAADWKPNPISP